MATVNGFFEVERAGDTLVVTPTADLRELDFQGVESGAQAVLRQIDDPAVKNVVLDFHRTDYFGSTALGFFVRLWKRVSGRGGRLAMCNLSAHERDILRMTSLDGLWLLCGTKEEALRGTAG